MQITEIQNVYTQQEIANFSLLKDAFLQQNALYNNREALYELVRQTPKVLLMEYTEQANKYILFAMLENRVFKVLDHIKNGDISPVKAVSLRGNSYRSGSLFQFGFGNYDTPEFETRIFNIVHYTLMPPIPNFKNVFLDKCVEALMFKPQTNPDSARDFVFLLDNLLMLLKETPMESLYSNFITLPLLEFGDFLTYDDNTILDRIQDFEGFGQDSMMWNVISKIQSIKKYAGEMIQYMISRENADDLPIEKFQDIVESAENFLNRIGWQNYHSKFILDKFMEGHISVVTSVSFNHDGTKIVSGSRDRTVRVWNSETGECVLTLEGHTQGVMSVSFNHDGTKIVSGSGDKTVRVWNSETGECVLTLEGHTDFVNSVSFNHDGTKIVSGSSDKTVRVWNSETGECLLTLEDHTDFVNSVSFNHDGTKIVSGSWDKTVRVWNSETGECVLTLEDHTRAVMSVSFNHDGTEIVSGSRDRTVRVWNSETGECVLTLEGHTDFVNSVSFNHDGTKIVSGSSDKTVRVWNSEIGECLLTLEGNTDYVTSVSFNHDGTKIISGSRDRTVRVWIGSLITNEDSDTEVEYTETEIQDSDTEYEDSATERESENEASNEDPVLNLKAVLGVMYDLQQFRNYTLPETRLVMEINDEDCDIGDADTKKEYPVKINVSANGVEWDSQGTSADAKLYVFCASDLKTWLNTHTGSNTFGIDSVYLENQDLHNKNPFNNKIIYGVQYLTQEEIDQEMTKYDSTEGEEDLKSQLYAQIVELRLKIIKLENEIKKLDNDKSDLERRKRFLEIQLRQKQTTLNIMRQPTSIKLKL